MGASARAARRRRAGRPLAAPPCRSTRPALAFGNGRSYGDVCLNDGGVLWATRGPRRFIAFDGDRRARCEAGVMLARSSVSRCRRLVPAGHAGHALVTRRRRDRQRRPRQEPPPRRHVRRARRAPTCCAPTAAVVCSPARRRLVPGDGRRPRSDRPDRVGEVRLRPVAGPWIETRTHAVRLARRVLRAISARLADARVHGRRGSTALGRPPARARGLFFAATTPQRSNRAPRREALQRAVRRRRSRSSAAAGARLQRPYYRAPPATQRRARQTTALLLPARRPAATGTGIYGPRGFHQYQCVVPARPQRDATRELSRRSRRSAPARSSRC